MSFKRILRNLLKNYSKAVPKLKYAKSLKKELSKKTASDETYIIATNTAGNHALFSFDLLLGLALLNCGKKVKFVICDGMLSACQMCEIDKISVSELAKNGPQSRLCGNCYPESISLLEKLGIEVIKLSEISNEYDYEKVWETNLSSQVEAGVLRYLAKGELENCSKEELSIVKNFSSSANLVFRSYLKLIKQENPSKMIFHHGIYVPQGAAYLAARVSGVESICWGVGYRKGTVIFSKGDSYHKTLPLENSNVIDSFALSGEQIADINSYLSSRETGKNDWISFSQKSNTNKEKIYNDLNLNRQKPTALLLTNVLWDAKVHFQNSIYSSMQEWVFDTIKAFVDMPEKQLIIRVHPAEHSGTIRSRQSIEDEIRKYFINIPKNITIVSAKDTQNDTYNLIDCCDVSLVFGTKAAIEIAARGIRVIVSGDAWVRGKGFTIDPISITEYQKLLKSNFAKIKMTSNEVNKAIKYAYYIFYKRMIFIKNLEPLSRFSPFVLNKNIKTLKSLENDKGLQFIIDQITEGGDFSSFELKK